MVESWIGPLEAGDPEAAWDRFIERYRRDAREHVGCLVDAGESRVDGQFPGG